MISPTACHILVEGRVQGVGFRYFVQAQAENLGVNGWVRNRERGEVEVLAEGQREDIDRLILLLERGPSAAYVSNITIEWQAASGQFSQFSIAPTDW